MTAHLPAEQPGAGGPGSPTGLPAAAVAASLGPVPLAQRLVRGLPMNGSLLWGTLLGAVTSFVAEMTYPVLLLVCLRWPETRRAAPPGRAFSPVLATRAE